MTLAIPSLTQAFSALGNFLGGSSKAASPALAPAVPKVSTPLIGVSSLSSLQNAGVKTTPAVPSLSPAPNATSSITKQPVYIPPNSAAPIKSTAPAIPSVNANAPAQSAAVAGTSVGGRSVVGPSGPGAYVPYPSGAGGAYTPYTGTGGGASIASPAIPSLNAPNATSAVTGQPVYGPDAPAFPATPKFAPPVTAPSGTVVDPNTGAVVPPPTGASAFSGASDAGLSFGSNTGNASSASNYSSSAGGGISSVGGFGGTPGSSAVGADGLTDEERKKQLSGGGTDASSSLFNNPADQAAYDAYQASLQMSPEETAANAQLAALTTAASQAYTNTQNQPIALPFITGQQAALQREQGTLAQPLESQLALAQARRTTTSTAAKAALDRQDAILAAKRDLATKTINTTYGGTTAQFNPATGKYETVVNPFGTTSGAGGDVTTMIGNAIANGQLTSDQVTRYGIPFIQATLQSDPGYNFITQKAGVASDTASLKTNQSYADSTSRAFNTANANLSQLVGFMTTNGVNQSTVPAINQLQNRVKSGLTDAGTIAAFNAGLAGLRAEYAQVLSRGGEVTEGQRAQAAQLIPDDISPAQLQQVADRLNVEGTNAVAEANAKVKEIQTRLAGNTGSSSNSSSSSGSIYDF